jgi:hypothetical protein
MSTALETAVIFLGANGLAGYATAVYVVRRVAAQPKPPAPAQSRAANSTRNRGSADTPAPDEKVPAANGSGPAGSTA